MLNRIAHIHGDLLPGHKAQIPLFQNELILRIGDGLDHPHDFTLQIHQVVDILVDFMLSKSVISWEKNKKEGSRTAPFHSFIPLRLGWH